MEIEMNEDSGDRSGTPAAAPPKDDIVYFNNKSREEWRALYEVLVEEVFYAIDMDPNEHQDCLQSCVNKALATRALKATSWVTWDGYEELYSKMKMVNDLIRDTGLLHCPPACDIIIAMVVMVRHEAPFTGTDPLTRLFNGLGIPDLAPLAIRSFSDYRDRVFSQHTP